MGQGERLKLMKPSSMSLLAGGDILNGYRCAGAVNEEMRSNAMRRSSPDPQMRLPEGGTHRLLVPEKTSGWPTHLGGDCLVD